jgi:hypothetical protein
MNKIGTVTESSLHSALKHLYAFPEDRIEEPVLGYLVDVLRTNEIVEIQTGNFVSFRRKLTVLLQSFPVRVVVPIAVQRHIVRIAKDGTRISRRRSPKKGRLEDLFNELVRIPTLLNHPNLKMEVAWVNDEIYWIDDGKGSWRRRRWSIKDRVLVNFVGAHVFSGTSDYLDLVPSDLEGEFSSRQFAQASKMPVRLAAKTLYCLRAMNLIEIVGRKGNAYIYKRAGQV